MIRPAEKAGEEREKQGAMKVVLEDAKTDERENEV